MPVSSSINPITRMDYPDPDVIRVDDTYYMVSTTMYFMPGCEILRSYDLVHWEHAAYVYDRLDSTPAQRLEDGKNIYGCGMWAASLRYHDGIFYICFVANDTHKTYLYREFVNRFSIRNFIVALVVTEFVHLLLFYLRNLDFAFLFQDVEINHTYNTANNETHRGY